MVTVDDTARTRRKFRPPNDNPYVGEPEAALLALYDTALPRVYRYLLSRRGQPALAEDLAGDTFTAAADDHQGTRFSLGQL